VLTFLSPSPAYSRSAVAFLDRLFGLIRVDATSRSRDGLDALHFGSRASSPAWESAACACPSSGAVLHFLSPSTGRDERNIVRYPALHLVGVHGSHSTPIQSDRSRGEKYQAAVLECRQRLSDHVARRQLTSGGAAGLEARLRGTLLNIIHGVLGKQPTPSWLLSANPFSKHPTSPMLDLSSWASNGESPVKHGTQSAVSSTNTDYSSGKLREIALPFFPGTSSVQAVLAKSSLIQPLPGLYQCSAVSGTACNPKSGKTTDDPGLIFRPLPAAEEDLHLSSPSLVFQCDCLDTARATVEKDLGGRVDRIGWRGHGQPGSLIVRHSSIMGLDIRISAVVESEGWPLSSRFDESSEALMAGSLAELQSVHVASSGEADATAKEDPKILKGDCWMEFRERNKRPFKQLLSPWWKKPKAISVAKPPDIPYE